MKMIVNCGQEMNDEEIISSMYSLIEKKLPSKDEFNSICSKLEVELRNQNITP